MIHHCIRREAHSQFHFLDSKGQGKVFSAGFQEILVKAAELLEEITTNGQVAAPKQIPGRIFHDFFQRMICFDWAYRFTFDHVRRGNYLGDLVQPAPVGNTIVVNERQPITGRVVGTVITVSRGPSARPLQPSDFRETMLYELARIERTAIVTYNDLSRLIQIF